MNGIDIESNARQYLAAFDARDLQGCLSHFCDNPTIGFLAKTYVGNEQVEQWHKERFDAQLRIVRLDRVVATGDTVTIEAVVTSKRLKAWLINQVSGSVTARYEDGKIKEVKFSWNQ